jgi:hypothetical protein
MGIDYDAWLEQPYQEQYEWDELCERYEESGSYEDDLAEWLADPENEGLTEEDWRDSSNFASCVECWASDY